MRKRQTKERHIISTEMAVALMESDKEFLVQFGARVTARRHELGLTQAQLAEQLGLSQQMILSIEKGRRRLSITLLPAFSDALSISLDELVRGVAPRARAPRGPASKLHRQIEAIRGLPRTKQRFVVEMLDTVIAQEGGT